MEKLVITIAPTGSIPTRDTTPHVPITPEEIVADCVRCVEAGASVCHVHVREPDGRPSTRFDLFRQVAEGLRARTDAVLQISTGGRAGSAFEERSERLELRPEMASLTTGSVNFPEGVYANPRDLVERLAGRMKELAIKPEMEIFDVSMVEGALDLARKGLAEPPLHFNFVLGLKGALPATPKNLLHLVETVPAGSTWTVSGIGRAQLPMAVHAILMGGHVRVGLEDNIYYAKGVLARNVDLVERVVRLARELGRPVATPAEARRILGLGSGGAAAGSG
ncbi:BKACE family enzyme [Deferrisoma camini]|uniref:3-keto-5-aminohexanoate cleavage protein n=1 Tax=Deferrisoma camini TaxID=1035120 RepID=UPI00046D3FE8|nr:3-keto-5-aminohexanoate cleavage protein [Deferrisoma camini]